MITRSSSEQTRLPEEKQLSEGGRGKEKHSGVDKGERDMDTISKGDGRI
jgi:hypothetical protein